MKNTIMVALALLVAGATFNSVRAQQSPVTRIDSLSYSIGMSQTQGLKDYLSKQLKIDINYLDDFVKGLKEGAAESSQAKAAYYAGTQIGQQILRQMMPGINKELFGAESTKSISLDQFMAGFVSGVTGKDGLMSVEDAQTLAQRLMEQVKEEALLEQYGANKKAGEDFMAAQAKLAKARSLLTKTVMKATDLLSDEKEPVEVDGPIVEAYNAKMAAYYDAYLEYNNHRLAALAGDDPKAVHDWAMNGQFYFNKVRAAMNAWVTQGYKNDYEQINAFIANVTERDLSLLKAQYKEILQRSMMTGLISGLEFPFTTISPANFAQASGWTEFTFNTRHYKDHSDSQVNNHSLKVDQTSTSWFHKQHYMYGKEEPYQEMDMGAELANLDISFKICQVNIVRPWFKPSFLASKSWRFAPGSEDGRKGTLLSTGGPRPEGILPAYPTAMLVVKDVVFDFHDTQVASNFKHKYDQVSHDGGLGVSVGFFGIGARGNVAVLDNKKHDGNENGIIQTKSKVTIPGMQVIGYRCHMLDKSPDPLPSIKEWA